MIIKAAKRIFNSGKICRSYCDFYFGVTFWSTLYLCFFTENAYKNMKNLRVQVIRYDIVTTYKNELIRHSKTWPLGLCMQLQ